MIHMTTHEVDDLRHCQRTLERVLASLDTAGAGIAAIHVNAAIEQLKKNLSVVAADFASADGSGIFFSERND